MDNENNAVVLQRIEVSPGLIILRVAPRDGELPEFTPGQFAVLGLPGKADRCAMCDEEETRRDPEKMIKRAYSIASSSVAREYIELYIVLVPSGALTPRLFALEHGEEVWLSPKFKGLFTLEQVPADKHVVLISTGTGLAPYMSMLRSQLQCGGPQYFAVLHGARHSWDLGYRSELRTMDRMCKNFTYIPSVTRPDEESVKWTGYHGYIQDLWQDNPLTEKWGFKPSPENTHYFLCGNPGMILSMLKHLEAEGFQEHTSKQPGQVHVERYW